MSLSRNASSRGTVQRRKNVSCLRYVLVFFLWHTSRHKPIAVIGCRCRSRAGNLQPCMWTLAV